MEYNNVPGGTEPVARKYSFPDGHWNWPVDLTHQHAVRAGNMVFTGGQVDLDPRGNVRNPGNLDVQCVNALAYMDDLFQDLGVDRHDLVRIVAYFCGDATDEERYIGLIANWLGPDVRPVISTICMPELCYPDMRVEIEGVAMRAENDERLPRTCLRLDDMPALHPAFSHVVRCGEMIFTSDMSSVSGSGIVGAPHDIVSQTTRMMDRVVSSLRAVDADIQDVVKLNVFFSGSDNAEDWAAAARVRADYFSDPGPAATGISVPNFPQAGLATKIAVTAIAGENCGTMERSYSWPEGHWDWTIPLPYKHGNKCGHMIHLGGQVSLDSAANVIDPDDMVAQTKRAMNNIASILAEFGATLDDVVKVTTFYQGAASAEVLHENLMVRSESYTAPGPATTGVPVRNLIYDQMVIEIDVIAMLED